MLFENDIELLNIALFGCIRFLRELQTGFAAKIHLIATKNQQILQITSCSCDHYKLSMLVVTLSKE